MTVSSAGKVDALDQSNGLFERQARCTPGLSHGTTALSCNVAVMPHGHALGFEA